MSESQQPRPRILLGIGLLVLAYCLSYGVARWSGLLSHRLVTSFDAYDPAGTYGYDVSEVTVLPTARFHLIDTNSSPVFRANETTQHLGHILEVIFHPLCLGEECLWEANDRQ